MGGEKVRGHTTIDHIIIIKVKTGMSDEVKKSIANCIAGVSIALLLRGEHTRDISLTCRNDRCSSRMEDALRKPTQTPLRTQSASATGL